jgi:hypothetical protein
MSQPVKLSDTLIDAARAMAADANRSLAGQIEHWASIGRAMERTLTAADVHALKRSNAAAQDGTRDSEFRDIVINALEASLRPGTSDAVAVRIGHVSPVRYGADPAFPGLIVRIDADGTKTPGRFVGRTFMTVAELNQPERASSRA